MEHLLSLLTQYGYRILFPLAIVEGLILSVLAGLLCTLNVLNPFPVLLVIVTGDVIGDSLYYGLGRWRSQQELPSIVGRFMPSRQQVDRVRILFRANPVRTIVLAKVVLGIGLTGIYLAGNAKISFQKFLLICLGTSLCQSTIYVIIGMLFGRAYQRIGSWLNGLATFTILAALAAGLVYFVWSRRNR